MFQLQKGQQRERKTSEGQEEKQKHKLKSKDPQGRGERKPWKSKTVNEIKDRNTQKQETYVIKGRKKTGEGVIRKVRTQRVPQN